jgi:single-stranded DNA-binding protein
LGNHLSKGSKTYVEARLQISSWDDKETGQKRWPTGIVANEMIMLDPARGSGAGRGKGDEGGDGLEDINSDDIPFSMRLVPLERCLNATGMGATVHGED